MQQGITDGNLDMVDAKSKQASKQAIIPSIPKKKAKLSEINDTSRVSQVERIK
jgi:hypothetical protein